MSTGDQTQYIRTKLAERGSDQGARFMTDGFDRWAESEIPAREGQVEKNPAESQMANYGGAMTLAQAKKYAMMGGRHGGMHGGIDLMATAKKAVSEAKKLITMWRGVSQWINALRQELQDEFIDNPAAPASYKNVSSKILDALTYIQGAQAVLDGIAAATALVGLGKHGGRRMHGGASVTLEQIGQYAAQIAYWYAWFVQNGAAIRTVLGFKSVQPVGKEVLKYLDPILKALGAGRHGGVKQLGFVPLRPGPVMGQSQMALGGNRSRSGSPKHCMCDHHGGTHPTDMSLLDLKQSMGGRRRVGGIREVRTPSQVFKMSGPEFSEVRTPNQVFKMSGPDFQQAVGGRRVGGKAPSARGAIVSKVMREHGLSLPQASKYVKEHGLY